MREPVHAAKALRIRAPLLGVRNRVDAVADAFDDGIVALPENHFFRVAKEMAHRDPEAANGFGDVALDRRCALRPRDGSADAFARSERPRAFPRHSHAPMLAVRVPPAIAANFADVLERTRRCSAGLNRNRTMMKTATKPTSATNASEASPSTPSARRTAGPALWTARITIPVTTMFARDAGSNLRQPSFMSWSYRNRGSVQRMV